MVYNAFGQKKRETNPDSDTLFTWDGDDYYGFADAANDPENAVKIFIGDGGTMLGELDPTDSKSRVDYMVDFLGSVTGSTDKNGGLLGSDRRYKPFGEVLSGDPVKALNFAWTGNTGSMHTGMLYSEQYNRARHYSTTTNIWTTRDPFWPNEHAYGYVNGNPVMRVDPYGTSPCPASGIRACKRDCSSRDCNYVNCYTEFLYVGFCVNRCICSMDCPPDSRSAAKALKQGLYALNKEYGPCKRSKIGELQAATSCRCATTGIPEGTHITYKYSCQGRLFALSITCCPCKGMANQHCSYRYHRPRD
ncbi:MAG: hypothetical protein J0L72_04195 [Armatimonadetes bacterium]|nr:hypothetical protein [Armatimonadota bacterium]